MRSVVTARHAAPYSRRFFTSCRVFTKRLGLAIYYGPRDYADIGAII